MIGGCMILISIFTEFSYNEFLGNGNHASRKEIFLIQVKSIIIGHILKLSLYFFATKSSYLMEYFGLLSYIFALKVIISDQG